MLFCCFQNQPAECRIHPPVGRCAPGAGLLRRTRQIFYAINKFCSRSLKSIDFCVFSRYDKINDPNSHMGGAIRGHAAFFDSCREEQLNKLFRAVAELPVKNAKEGVPETGSFRKLAVCGGIKELEYEGILGIEQSYRVDNERRVTSGGARERR